MIKKWLFYAGLILSVFSIGFLSGCSLVTGVKSIGDGMLRGDTYIKSKILMEIVALRAEKNGKESINYYDVSKVLSHYFVQGIEKNQVIAILQQDNISVSSDEDHKVTVYYRYGFFQLIVLKFFFDSQQKLVGWDGMYLITSNN
ncbi:MAG: hypothetical protein AB7D20_11430 [Sulfuricurvum sp.]|uniref:hypothetical protein n=1 Tax=Sulfuricurvum sp. TaxID=2025608 RepID=UPI003D0D1CE3